MRSHKTRKRTQIGNRRKQTRNRRKQTGGMNHDEEDKVANQQGPFMTGKRNRNNINSTNNTTFEQEENMATYLQNRGAKKPKLTVEQVQQQVEQLNHEDKATLFQKLASMLRKKN